tara:strand:- start:2110 stop:2553 length:444 start_codon:yes stop_codon:yes gene_type:complete
MYTLLTQTVLYTSDNTKNSLITIFETSTTDNCTKTLSQTTLQNQSKEHQEFNKSVHDNSSTRIYPSLNTSESLIVKEIACYRDVLKVLHDNNYSFFNTEKTSALLAEKRMTLQELQNKLKEILAENKNNTEPDIASIAQAIWTIEQK